MKIIRIAVFAGLIFSIFTRLYSQDTIQEKQTFKNSIALNLSRFVWNEARFGYERRITERHTLRADVGLQYPTSESFENHSSAIGYGYEPYYVRVSTGIYIGAGYNYTINVNSGTYVSAEVYFNYDFYDEKYFIYGAGMNSECYISLESMQQKKTGFKFLFGKKFICLSGNKTGLEVDMFAGMGIQYRHREIIIFEKAWEASSVENGTFYILDPPGTETHKFWNPTVIIGFIIGMPWGLK